jgi:putative aldouronate transport system substrate-binding protein
MKAGKVMGGFNGMNPGNVDGLAINIGKPLMSWEMSKPFSITGHVANIMWCMSKNSENPEKAMEFLNFAFKSPEIENLLINGIEGKDYVVIDKEKNVIDYPESVDPTHPAYMRLPWAWPNAPIVPGYMKGENPDQWTILTNYNKSVHNSVAKGFVFNQENVQNELTATTNIVAKYDENLQAGSLDPSVALPKFISELKAAGVEKIVAEKQRQLDEYLASIKK